MSRSIKFTFKMRRRLEHLLSEGYQTAECAKEMGVCKQTLLEEIKKGMDLLQYKLKRYPQYSADLAQATEIQNIFIKAEEDANRLKKEMLEYKEEING